MSNDVTPYKVTVTVTGKEKDLNIIIDPANTGPWVIITINNIAYEVSKVGFYQAAEMLYRQPAAVAAFKETLL